MVRWGTPSRRASSLTARASPADAGRKQWSTVTAMSFGPRLSALRQRAISINRAVESGPPETARTRAETRASGANNAFASAAETGAASSAADTLLFSLDPLPHRGRRARKFAHDFSERRAGRLLLAERGKRLSEAQKRIGRLGGGFVFGRDVEEGFRRVAEAVALEHAFAEPIGGVAGEPIIGILAQETVEGVFGERVVLAQHIAVSEIVFVARGLRGRERGERAAGSRVLRRLPRLRAALRPHGCEIERRGGAASAGSADRRLTRIGAHNGGPAGRVDRAERGAPGAFGFWAGSNASPRLPAVAAGDDGAGRFCGRDCTAPRGTPSSCMRRTCPSSCWLRNCSCSIAPVSCRIWVSRRSMRNMRSGAELCAVRSAPAPGALPPMRSLPLKMPNKPDGRSVSCAQAWRKTGPAAVIAAKMSAEAVVTRSAKRAMAILVCWNPGIPYESLRPNCD